VWASPISGLVGSVGTIVSLDSRGRLLLPADIRAQFGTRRFLLTRKEGRLELEPIPEPGKVRGRYKGLVRKDLASLEEDQERFLREGRGR